MFDTTDWGASSHPGIGQLRSSVSELSDDPLDDLYSDTLSERLVALLEVRERLDAELTRVTAQWVKRRAWEADGALAPAPWLAHRGPIERSDARRLVKAARLHNAAPELAAALASGKTTSSHINALARVVSRRRERLLAEHGEVLAKQATRLSIGDFGLLARRWASLADDQLAADIHGEAEPPRNEVVAGVSTGGRIVGNFDLDPISGARWLGVLDHIEPPDPVDAPDGPRTLAQRRGDALGELAARYHDGGTAGANPPNLEVIVDVATLNGATPDLIQARCELEGVGPITAATLEQLKCSATVTRLVMAGSSVVLDMGRSTRFATKAQTRAIRARDRGCVFPGCGRRPKWCDVHHVDGWASGGRTDVARMCLLCRRHHTLIHNSKWTITINNDSTFRVSHPIRAP